MLCADLFDGARDAGLGAGVALLQGFALPSAAALVADVRKIAAAAPFRQMTTPGGFRRISQSPGIGLHGSAHLRRAPARRAAA